MPPARGARHPHAAFREAARALLDAAAPGAGLDPGAWGFAPAPAGKGDVAVPCFPFAAKAKRNPTEIAAALAGAAQPHLEGHPSIGAVEAVGPYVNLHAAPRPFVEATLRQATDPSWGALAPVGKRVMVEHTSANPNGPLHVGRARNPIIGDTLARVMRAAGWDVEAQYYLDDMGKQVAILAWGLENLQESELPAVERGKEDHRLVRFYQKANERMEAEPAVAEAVQDIVRGSEEGDREVLARLERAYSGVLAGMNESMARLGVRFDRFVKESDYVVDGSVAKVVAALEAQRTCPVGREGEARFLDLAQYGIPGRSARFFFVRSDGTSLYATRDVAYHLWKTREADRLINVLGEDHKLQARQVAICLELLGASVRPEVVFYSFVSLPEGKMSTRRGRVVHLDDLLDEAVERATEEVRKRRGAELAERLGAAGAEKEMQRIAEEVGVGALRFNIVRVQAEKPIVFKWEEALAFDGFSAPFVQYGHARCASILRKAKEEGLAAEKDPAKAAALLEHPSEVALAKALARLPLVVEESARDLKVHNVATYCFELATAANAFYRDCPVLTAAPDLARARLALVGVAKASLAKALGLLGIAAPESM